MSCQGSVAPCETYFISMCYKRQGCHWENNNCYGIPKECHETDNKFSCLLLDNDCYWINDPDIEPEIKFAIFVGVSLFLSFAMLFLCCLNNKIN